MKRKVMDNQKNMKKTSDKIDEGLLGNERIEEAILALQQQPTQELLAHALTVVRRRMRENGQVIIAVEPNAAAGQMKLQAVKTTDGNSWWAVFTSFDEELKGSGSVMSTFMSDIGKVLEAALSEEEIKGVSASFEKVLSEEIVDQSWFPLDWQKDPTINSMLVMLDAIHECFADVPNIWNRLKEHH